jgi:hypothetical protein
MSYVCTLVHFWHHVLFRSIKVQNREQREYQYTNKRILLYHILNYGCIHTQTGSSIKQDTKIQKFKKGLKGE